MKQEERKIKAVELMEQLGIYKPYVKDFKDNNTVCFFENFAGFWAWQDDELNKKIKEIEEEYNCTVYAVTHEFTQFGELYDFLIVTNYPEEWDNLVYTERNEHTAFAYVWNKSDDWCSEFGSIAVQNALGGITRIG